MVTIYMRFKLSPPLFKTGTYVNSETGYDKYVIYTCIVFGQLNWRI